MENREESIRWMKDAKADFRRAGRCFREKDWQGAVQNAQLAIELCVKAIIAIFEEPDWTHKPSEQLMKIVQERKKEIEKRFGQQMINALTVAAEDVVVAAPWHGWSVYGKAREDSTGWISAVDLCTRDIAEDLIKRVQRTFTAVEKFIQGIEEN